MDITLANNDYILTKEFHVKIQNSEFANLLIFMYFVILGPKAFQ